MKPPRTTPKCGLPKTKADIKTRTKIIVSEILKGKSKTQAMINAGYSKAYATTEAGKITNKPTVQRAIREIYEHGGITDDFLLQKHLELINASEVKVFNDKDAGIVYSAPLTDNDTQLNAVRLAHQLKGNLIEKHELDLSGSLAAAVAAHLSTAKKG